MNIARLITPSLSAILIAASTLTAEEVPVAINDLPDTIRVQLAHAAGGAALSDTRVVEANGQKTYIATYRDASTGSMRVLNVDQNGRVLPSVQGGDGANPQIGTTTRDGGTPAAPPVPTVPGSAPNEAPTITSTPPPGIGPNSTPVQGTTPLPANNGVATNPPAGGTSPNATNGGTSANPTNSGTSPNATSGGTALGRTKGGTSIQPKVEDPPFPAASNPAAPRVQANQPTPATPPGQATTPSPAAQPARPGLQHAEPGNGSSSKASSSSSTGKDRVSGSDPKTEEEPARPGKAGEKSGSTKSDSKSGEDGSGKASNGSGAGAGSSGGSGK